MALKIPSLSSKDNKQTTTSPVTPGKPTTARKKSGSLMEKLFGRKKSVATTATISERKDASADAGPTTGAAGTTRSEERRVGKEC